MKNQKHDAVVGKRRRIGRKKERTVDQRGKTNRGEAWHSLVDYRRRLLEKITVRFRHSVNFWPWVRSCVRSLDRSWLKPLANLYHVWTSYRHEEASRYEFGVTSPTKFNSFLVQLFSPPLLSTLSFSLSFLFSYPSISLLFHPVLCLFPFLPLFSFKPLDVRAMCGWIIPGTSRPYSDFLEQPTSRILQLRFYDYRKIRKSLYVQMYMHFGNFQLHLSG